MTHNNIFELKNVSCFYLKKDNTKKVVLKIAHLDIQRGRFVVILGKSGSGKTTLLENLGLMNNTLEDGSQITLKTNDDKIYDYSQIWQHRNSKLISCIRNDYFSFIFQETNLMPNFTVYENIALTQLYQGISLNNSFENIEEIMKSLGMERDINKETMEFNISGGQKQRAAFIRAIVKDFDVLFGDEPTGNLDINTSRNLMNILKTKVSEGKSVLIVSHNIELSLLYADMLIVINREKNEDVSTITPDCIFYRKDNSDKWLSSAGEEILNMEILIENILKK